MATTRLADVGPGATPINNPLMPGTKPSISRAARQMQHGRALMESRPFLTRVPDPSIVMTGPVPTSVPGAGRYQFAATRDGDGSYAMVYAPVGRRFRVRMNVLAGAQVRAWWFNPRTGGATALGTFSNSGERDFTPPEPGEMLDWVLVLDDASKNYPPPGQRR